MEGSTSQVLLSDEAAEREEPLLASQPKPTTGCCHRRRRLCALVSHAFAGCVGAASVVVYVFLVGLRQQPLPPAIEPTCPGVCIARPLDGKFGSNITTHTQILGVEVINKFSLTHHFHFANGSVDIHLVPISSSLPFDPTPPMACDGVPFVLDGGCNITFSDPCTQSAYKAQGVVSLTLLYNPGLDVLEAQETISNNMFTQTFTWNETRLT